MDWGSEIDVLHVGDINIVPGTVYEVRAVDCACDPSEPPAESEPLTIVTSRFGDITEFLGNCPVDPPDGANNVDDILAVLSKFSSATCAILKSRADLEPADLDRQINVSDALQTVRAFQGLPYDLSIPVGCEQ